MTEPYTLTLTCGAETMLRAELTFNPDTGRLDIANAAVDVETDGQTLSVRGRNAFRVLAMADLLICRALNLKMIDPQEEIDALKRIVAEQRVRLNAIQGNTELLDQP